MNPISSSHQNPFPLQAFDKAHIESALNYLKEHKELRLTLSKKDFTVLKAYKQLSPLFQEVFSFTPKTHSIFQRAFSLFGSNYCTYDQILELRLDAWAELSANNQKAKEKILSFLENHSKTSLDLCGCSVISLPDIWQHSAFTSRLQKLDLSSNRLTSLPESIGNLSHLQILDLSSNQLTSLPESIRNLSHLQRLYLLNNQLTSLLESIRNLSHLQMLRLDFNQLTSLPSSFGTLAQLRDLTLSRNPSLTSLPEEIFQLSHDCRINLENCGLSAHVVAQMQTRMNTAGYTGPRITFSIREASTSSKAMNELLSELFRAAGMTPFPLPTEWNNNESLRTWLNRLSSMADYNAGGGANRKALASKILSFLAIDLNSAS